MADELYRKMDDKLTVIKGMIGAGTATGATIVSYLGDTACRFNIANLEQWLRVTSLCVGILVGLLTGVSIILSIWRNKKK